MASLETAAEVNLVGCVLSDNAAADEYGGNARMSSSTLKVLARQTLTCKQAYFSK